MSLVRADQTNSRTPDGDTFCPTTVFPMPWLGFINKMPRPKETDNIFDFHHHIDHSHRANKRYEGRFNRATEGECFESINDNPAFEVTNPSYSPGRFWLRCLAVRSDLATNRVAGRPGGPDRVSDHICQAFGVDRSGFGGAHAPSVMSVAGTASRSGRGTTRHPGSSRRRPV